VNIRDGRCLDVSGNKDTEGREVIVNNRQDSANQRWRVVYVDKAKKEPTKGLNKEFGMWVNRPFYMVARLPFHRVMEAISANNIVIKRWRKNVTAQQFFFDGVSKTIRSQQWKNYALEKKSNGNSANLGMSSTVTSRWW